MSCRSRYGGYYRGKDKIKNRYSSIKTDNAPAEITFDKAYDFDYTYGKGIWGIESTNQFPKTQSGGGGGGPAAGLSSSLLTVSGTNDAWTQQTIDISSYANATVRLIFRYQNGNGFSGDIQIDNINIDGNSYSFENVTHSFDKGTNDTATFASVSWSSLAVESDNRGVWQVDSGGTPSNGTGRTDASAGSYYVYYESSSPGDATGYNAWLRSPEITLGGSPTLTFYEARNGSNIGSLDVYLEVIA